METLLKSFDSFSARHANTSFFRAINPDVASDIMSDGSITAEHLGGPVHLTTSLEHAQNYLPHHPVVEFVLKPESRVVDLRHYPKSETDMWDASLPNDLDDTATLGRKGLVDDGLIDAIFDEFSDMMEVHQHGVLTPVRLHPAAL